MTEENTELLPPTPVRYGSFNQRVIASVLDLGLLFMLVLPVVQMFMAQLFPPINTVALEALINSPEFDTGHDTSNVIIIKILTSRHFWDFMNQQHMIARIIVENLLQIICIGFYVLPFWFRHSSTPGKMLFRLQIQDQRTGNPMSEKQALLRFFGYIFSTLTFSAGFLCIALNKKRRGFHDYIAGTVVVMKPRKKKISTSPPST